MENLIKYIKNFITENKSSMFDLEELWNGFDGADALTKIVCVYMFGSYCIITFIISIAINLYGNYLLDRFKLEERYPKIAIFINIRKKVSKYYILSNIISIILISLANIIFGFFVLSIIHT
jgi:hypothetical protein